MTGAPTGAATRAEPRGLVAWWQGQRGLRRMLRRRMPVFGLAVVLAFVVVAVAAPWVAPYDPARTGFTSLRQPPSDAYPLGTDEIGRDSLSRVPYGARASLLAGVIGVLIAMLLAAPLGMVAGYYGGLLDELLA